LSDEPQRRAYVLNTRPVLNFLGVNRWDVLAAALGEAVYLSPSVLEEIREHVGWTRRDFDRPARLSPETIDPDEITFIEGLSLYDSQLRPPRVRLLQAIDLAELAISDGYMRAGRLDPGESEVLALGRQRGSVVVIDEFIGHCQAEADRIAQESTLGILVRAVTQGHFGSVEVSQIWARMQAWWDYAPSRSLGEYLAGRAIWPLGPAE
jgi:predicted nucleic acid-binding protein